MIVMAVCGIVVGACFTYLYMDLTNLIIPRSRIDKEISDKCKRNEGVLGLVFIPLDPNRPSQKNKLTVVKGEKE